MSADTPAKDQDKFVLRLPDGMRDRLKAEAEANKRSMNAEIVARLEFSLQKAERVRESLYHGDRPMELSEEILEGIMQLFERARAEHDAKYGETPPERRKPVAFPVRVADPEPLPIESYPDEALQDGLKAIEAEIARRHRGAEEAPKGGRRIDLDDREPGKEP